MNEVELKPCPFCGRAARMVVDPTPGFYPAIYHAECASCGAAPAGTWENPAFAAEAWNRRTSPWRSVEKELPEAGKTVFVKPHLRAPSVMRLDGSRWSSWYEDIGDVRWWMPIPPLPKEVEG